MRYVKLLPRLLLIPLFALLISANTSAAQNTIAFTPNGLSGWPDTTYAADSAYVGAFLKNYSSDSIFADSFRVDGYVDTGAAFVFFSFDFYYLYGSFMLPPLDSGFLILPFVFDTDTTGGAYFHVGNNVVVVWPVSVDPSFNTGDSVTVNVFLIDTLNSLGPDHPPAELRIYPVPSTGPLYISSYHPQFHITTITIRNVMGQIMYTSNSPSGPINTEAWAPGLYTVEATLNNGSSSCYKILRQ